MYRKHLEFKTTLAKLDAGLSSGDMYEMIRKGFKGYDNFSDTELEMEYLKLTGKIIKIERGL